MISGWIAGALGCGLKAGIQHEDTKTRRRTKTAFMLPAPGELRRR